MNSEEILEFDINITIELNYDLSISTLNEITIDI